MHIVDACRAYLGVPFRHQGRNRLGLDCGGLLVVAARDCGIELQDIQGYQRQPDGKKLLQVMRQELTQVYRPPEYGDVVLMRLRKYPQHIAIITDKGMIHAHSEAGYVVEHRLDDDWRSTIVGVFELG